MKQLTIKLLFLIAVNFIYSQNKSNWTELDYLNSDNSSFETENKISGEFFITLTDTFDYYSNPIKIYNNQGREIVKIEFTENGITTWFKGKKYQQNDFNNPLDPWLLSLNPDYFRLAFECVEITASDYIVLLNEKEKGYISKSNLDFKTESTEDFVNGWMKVGFDFNRSTNPLRVEPIETSKIITNELLSKYKIWTGGFLEMKGDWIKIRTVKDEIGWIRWRKENLILIRMYYAC